MAGVNFEKKQAEAELYAEVPGLHNNPGARLITNHPDTGLVEIWCGSRALSQKNFGGRINYFVGVERYLPDGARSGDPVYRVVSPDN